MSSDPPHLLFFSDARSVHTRRWVGAMVERGFELSEAVAQGGELAFGRGDALVAGTKLMCAQASGGAQDQCARVLGQLDGRARVLDEGLGRALGLELALSLTEVGLSEAENLARAGVIRRRVAGSLCRLRACGELDGPARLQEVEWANVIAISVVALIPSIAVFFAAQKHFIEGATSSGVKG